MLNRLGSNPLPTNNEREVITMKHYFFLILNTYTYETYYNHGFYEDVNDIKENLKQDEKLVKVWEVSKEVPIN